MTNENTTPQPAPEPTPESKPTPTPQPAPTTSKTDTSQVSGVPAEDIDFEVDEDASTVATVVGGVGWPEGAENEEGTQADGTVAKS